MAGTEDSPDLASSLAAALARRKGDLGERGGMGLRGFQAQCGRMDMWPGCWEVLLDMDSVFQSKGTRMAVQDGFEIDSFSEVLA